MTRVMVIGAGGVFGRRLAEGLLRGGFDVVVAGRDAARARTTAQALGQAFPGRDIATAVLDARTVTPDALRTTGAGIVVDAAGPFQGAAPRTAEAAIAAGLHYVDLADGRDFVAAFSGLDQAARAAGVAALTGCSSTPALSNAALDHLTLGWREVVSVEAAISPGARAPRGLSVMRAILSWLGRPVRVFEGGRWRSRAGWTDLRRRHFGVAGRRWVSLCETPDLDIFPARFRPREHALFRAGLEPAAAHFGVWALAWTAAVTRLDLRPAAEGLLRLSTLFARFGSDRGAMRVEAFGVDADGRAVRAVWRLTAAPGEGPVTPSLPALAAIKAMAAGGIEPGARACVGELSLEALAAEMAPHGLATEIQTSRAAIFARAIGPAFDRLPGPVRALHETPGRSLWAGEAWTRGATGAVAAVVAKALGFPGAGEWPVRVEIDADGDRSIWRRRIGRSSFRSVLSRPGPGGRVRERFGPISVDLELTPESGRLVYRVRGWRLGPVPLPAALAPTTRTHEAVDDQGRFVFDVEIGLPMFGRLTHYRGWLERVA